MATMVVEIYDALRSIGVTEEKATKAAEAMATLEPQFAAIRQEYRSEFAATRQEYRDESAAMRQEYRGEFAATRQEYRDESAAMRQEYRGEFATTRQEYLSESAAMRQECRGEFAAVRSDLRVLTLRVNLIIAALLTLGTPALWLLLRIASKTGAIG
jgi:hypothetical protein